MLDRTTPPPRARLATRQPARTQPHARALSGSHGLGVSRCNSHALSEPHSHSFSSPRCRTAALPSSVDYVARWSASWAPAEWARLRTRKSSVPGKATPGAVWRGAHRCGRSAAAGSVRAFNGRGHCRVGWRGPMRCPAPPNACTEAAAVTDSCGWSGAWRAGEEAGKLLRATVRRFLGGIGGSGAFVGDARRLRRVHRHARCVCPHARLPRRSVPRWKGWAWRNGRCLDGPFGGFASSACCLGGLFDRRRCPRLGACLTCLLLRGLCAPQGFVRGRDRRPSVGEGTVVADTRSAAPRAPSALLARGSGRRGPGPWSSEVVVVIGPPGRSHTAASRCPSDPAGGAWSRHRGPVGTG